MPGSSQEIVGSAQERPCRFLGGLAQGTVRSTERSAQLRAHRFGALDGLRGICAFLVLLFHVRIFIGPNFFAHGYLSVDIFFILSGFVLAFAYDGKLARGMTVRQFFLERVRRLGPMLWIGALAGTLSFAAITAAGSLSVAALTTIIEEAAATAFLIPHIGAGMAFPLNSVVWSLFAEICVNLAFAAVAVRLGTRSLMAIIAAGWMFLIFYVAWHGTAHFGNHGSELLFGICRAVPSFSVGVLLLRFWRARILHRLPPVNPVLLFALWFALMAQGVGQLPALFDLVQIIAVAPLLIALLARWEGQTPEWMSWAGRLSYPFYITHYAYVQMAYGLGFKGSVWLLAGLAVLSLVTADVLARWVEPALRCAISPGNVPLLGRSASA